MILMYVIGDRKQNIKIFCLANSRRNLSKMTGVRFDLIVDLIVNLIEPKNLTFSILFLNS